MPIDEDGNPPTETSGDDDDDAEQREKVIVRSNGTVTYVGKDIANTLDESLVVGHQRSTVKGRPSCGKSSGCPAKPVMLATDSPSSASTMTPYGSSSPLSLSR